MKMTKMSIVDSLFYYLGVICTLGGAYLLKVIIKKAVTESYK